MLGTNVVTGVCCFPSFPREFVSLFNQACSPLSFNAKIEILESFAEFSLNKVSKCFHFIVVENWLNKTRINSSLVVLCTFLFFSSRGRRPVMTFTNSRMS